MSHPGDDGHRVHGLERDLVAPDWAPLQPEELREPLARLGLDTHDLVVEWRSPRPMSAAARVRAGRETVFVKRHHRRVRDIARLEREHRFGDHLRSRGVPTPLARRGPDGVSAVAIGASRYEVFDVASGHDRYRDVPSWYPYLDARDARDAGTVLARLHRAARDFAEPPEPLGVLLDGVELVSSDDPLGAFDDLVARRPGLARALAPYEARADVARVLAEPLERARAATRDQPRQWTHGDWHPSNLTWAAPHRVAAVIDLGLANETFALRDLAVAIERAVIDWLDQSRRGDVSVDEPALEALLAGYDEVSPLGDAERGVLASLLPVAHVEFALSEVEYFGVVTDSPANRDLAYQGYLLGHAAWFESPAGRALLARVRDGS